MQKKGRCDAAGRERGKKKNPLYIREQEPQVEYQFTLETCNMPCICLYLHINPEKIISGGSW
jgi:hypothetical protein